MQKSLQNAVMLACLSVGTMAYAADEGASITLNLISETGIGEEVGTISATDSEYGLLLTPNLKNLTAGVHGFHLHEKPDCNAGEKDGKPMAGLGAGGHFDPEKTAKHMGPYDKTGHLGDLPSLIVGKDGTATTPVLAPRLKVADLKGHSLMVHVGGDNFSDNPAALGGGGARMACGVVK